MLSSSSTKDLWQNRMQTEHLFDVVLLMLNAFESALNKKVPFIFN